VTAVTVGVAATDFAETIVKVESNEKFLFETKSSSRIENHLFPRLTATNAFIGGSKPSSIRIKARSELKERKFGMPAAIISGLER